MRAACPRCRLRFEREPGYFIGAIYINYGVTVVMALSGFLVLERFASFTLTEQLVLWTSFAALFPFVFYRHAKSLWLTFDCLIDPQERPPPPLRRVR
jgi:hypothetical protein